MRQIKLIKNKGILFWVTGLSGSGKTTIAKLIKTRISKLYGPTIIVSGDDLRNVFELRGFDKKTRLANGIKFSRLCKMITNQNINIIFAVVGLIEKIRILNRKNIKNYVEIYIKSNINKIIKNKKKKMYFKNKKNIVGLDIKPEFPKNPHIIIDNKFDKSMEFLSNQLIKKIVKIINNKNIRKKYYLDKTTSKNDDKWKSLKNIK
jgi:adenylylsulfate kinase